MVPKTGRYIGCKKWVIIFLKTVQVCILMSSLALFFKTNLIAADSEIQWITPSNVVSSREIWSVVVSQM